MSARFIVFEIGPLVAPEDSPHEVNHPTESEEVDAVYFFTGLDVLKNKMNLFKMFLYLGIIHHKPDIVEVKIDEKVEIRSFEAVDCG
jgi:hypothetical protein